MSRFSLELPCALGLDRVNAVFRQQPADFVVSEDLGFALTGAGEHLWLQVEKTGLNTQDVVRQLARLTGVREKDIGYAGLKDKQAVTTQWFSLAGVDGTVPESGADTGFRILQQIRNNRKLRRGSHRGNRFVITLREIDVAKDNVQAWHEQVLAQGCPNYFGPQRFGIAGGNLEKAAAWFAGDLKKPSRFQRGLYLSAARSWLFNQVLAARVTDNTWNAWVAGDVMALQGTGSIFRAEADDGLLAGRLARGDIHPTGPLWGKASGKGLEKARDVGAQATGETVQALEAAIAGHYADFAKGLAQAGLKQERRPLRVMPENLTFMPGAGQLVIEFSLPRGAYATSVLREMVIAAGL